MNANSKLVMTMLSFKMMNVYAFKNKFLLEIVSKKGWRKYLQIKSYKFYFKIYKLNFTSSQKSKKNDTFLLGMYQRSFGSATFWTLSSSEWWSLLLKINLSYFLGWALAIISKILTLNDPNFCLGCSVLFFEFSP